MPHSLIRVWIHCIWGTTERMPMIDNNLEKSLYEHIKEHLEKDYKCPLRAINGTKDHIHILFLLNQNYSVEEIIKNIKGESSHWINQNNLTKEKFSWQTGYGAFSVGDSKISAAEKYIENQKEHHKKISYAEKVKMFLKKYGSNTEILNC